MLEGWDFDGTMCYAPKGFTLKIYRFIEIFFPLITIILPLRKRPSNPNIIIITASKNKMGVVLWLRLHRIRYLAILFVHGFKNKEFFINKLCSEYIEIE